MRHHAHAKWECLYHFVWSPKKRRRVIFWRLSREIGAIIRDLAARKGLEIVQANARPDHVHLCLSIPPKFAPSAIIGYLKGKSTKEIFAQHSSMGRQFAGNKFWQRGYYVSTVGATDEQVREYIRNQDASEDAAPNDDNGDF